MPVPILTSPAVPAASESRPHFRKIASPFLRRPPNPHKPRPLRHPRESTQFSQIASPAPFSTTLWYSEVLTRIVLLALPLFLAARDASAQPAALLDAMSQELNRNFSRSEEHTSELQSRGLI